MIFDECQNHSLGERTVFSTNGAEKTDIRMQKNEVGPLPNIMYKN